jgi:hypothetical protein
VNGGPTIRAFCPESFNVYVYIGEKVMISAMPPGCFNAGPIMLKDTKGLRQMTGGDLAGEKWNISEIFPL